MFILVIILLGILTINIIGYSLFLGITPMPTLKRAKDEIVRILPAIDRGSVFELGAGFGSVALLLAKSYPQLSIIACERSPLPFAILWIRKKLMNQKNLYPIYKDFFELDLEDAALIYSYLYPKAMERLEVKLKGMNVKLISLAFALPRKRPSKKVIVSDLSLTPLYYYDLGANRGETAFSTSP